MSARSYLLGVVAASLALSACSKGSEQASSSSGSSSSSSGATTGGEPTPIRQVFERNPWGVPATNLLADGDFELSITVGTGQYGWIGLDATGANQIALVSETGGICRSGLRCAFVPKGQDIFGRGTAAANMAPLHASVFGKPATPPPAGTSPAAICKGVLSASIIDCDAGVVVRGLKPAPLPADDGYCEYSGDVPGSAVSLCMYIQVMEDAIVDNATLLPAPVPATKIEPFELDTFDSARAERAARYVRTHTHFGGHDAAPPVQEDLR